MANDDDMTIDLSDTFVTFTFHIGDDGVTQDNIPDNVIGIYADFLGFRFHDVNNTIRPFESISVASELSTVSIDSSRIWVDDDNIYFNGSGYTIIDGAQLTLRVQAQAVPAPNSLTLFVLGGLALVGGVIMLRRQNGAGSSAI